MKSQMEFTAEEQIREFFDGKRARAARTALTWFARRQNGGLRRLAVKLHQVDKLESEALSQFRKKARSGYVPVPVKPVPAAAPVIATKAVAASPGVAPVAPTKPAIVAPTRPPFPGAPEFSYDAVNAEARALADRLLKSFVADCQTIGSITLDNPPSRNASATVREEAAYLLHNRRIEKLNKLFFTCSNQVDDWARIQKEPLNLAKEQFFGRNSTADGAAIDQISAWINCVNRAAKQVTERLSAVQQRADGLLKQALRKHLREV